MEATETTPLLPVHNLDQLRDEVRTLVVLSVQPRQIEEMLRAQSAPPSAWIEARIAMRPHQTRFEVAEALLTAAASPDLRGAIPKACERWGIHPASLVALHTRGPLGFGLGLGLRERLVRSFPSIRRQHEHRGLWRPYRDFLPQAMPERLVLSDLDLWDQPRLETLPTQLWVKGRISLDRLPSLRSYGGALEGFQGALIIRHAPNLPPPPFLDSLARLVLDGQPWDSFPAGVTAVRGTAIVRHMPRLTALDPGLRATQLVVARCPNLREVPPMPLLGTPTSDGSFPRISWQDRHLHRMILPSTGLVLASCPVRELPRGFRLHGTLTVEDCWDFERLPEDLEVEHLVLRRLPALRHLPEGLRVHGHLVLDGLQNLEALPRGLEVGGDLALTNMATPPRLPDGLKLKGHLRAHPTMDATGCPSGSEHLHTDVDEGWR